MNLSILRRTAAEITAAAVYETYPDVELWGGGETPTGFSYDFYFPHPIHAHLVEEKMRQIVREKRPIRILEMVAFSAAELLRSKGHIARAETLEEGLVEVIQIGSFHDLSPGPHLKNTAELVAFKISIEPLANRGARIVGWCHRSKGELREFLKLLHNYVEPSELGERRGFWKGPIWLPQGLKMRQQLIDFLKKRLCPDAFEISGPSDADRPSLHRSLGQPKVAEIYLDPLKETLLQTSFFGQSEEEMISFLQSIGKTLTILGFDHSTVSTGQQSDYIVEDGLGRSHPIVRIGRMSKKGSPAVDFCFIASVERILSLLLEKNPMMVELENQ